MAGRPPSPQGSTVTAIPVFPRSSQSPGLVLKTLSPCTCLDFTGQEDLNFPSGNTSSPLFQAQESGPTTQNFYHKHRHTVNKHLGFILPLLLKPPHLIYIYTVYKGCTTFFMYVNTGLGFTTVQKFVNMYPLFGQNRSLL